MYFYTGFLTFALLSPVSHSWFQGFSIKQTSYTEAPASALLLEIKEKDLGWDKVLFGN